MTNPTRQKLLDKIRAMDEGAKNQFIYLLVVSMYHEELDGGDVTEWSPDTPEDFASVIHGFRLHPSQL